MFATFINGPDKFVGLFNAMLDENWTGGDLLETGKEVLRMERAFNDKSGVGPDRLPDWLCSEPPAADKCRLRCPAGRTGPVLQLLTCQER